MEKDTVGMQHDMPQFLVVFAVSRTLETPNIVTFGEVAHPLVIFFVCFCISTVYNYAFI